MGWTTFKAIFSLKKMKKVYIAWQNKGQTKVITTKKQEKVKDQVIKQLSLKENRGFPYCSVMKIEKQLCG